MSGRTNRRWIVMFALVLTGGTIYTLPYLRQAFHATMLEALGVTNQELGWLNSSFGVLALICYLPGGWVADKVSARKLLTVSMLVTGATGFAFAALPPYPILIALHALWGVTTILTYWAALIKATRAWGTADEQGKAFGFLDGGRGLIEGGVGLVAIFVFGQFANRVAGLQGVIVTYSVATIVGGVLAWFFIPEPKGDEASTAVSLEQFGIVAKMPVVWAHALVILFAYFAYWGTFDIAAFATDAFGQSDAFGAELANARNFIRPVAAITAGFLADKIKPSRAVTAGFLTLVVAYGAMAAIPTAASALWLLWIDIAVVAIAVYALRGVYYALLEEGGVPVYLTGTAVGFVSIIGYTPDIVMPIFTGWLLDTFPGAAGHRYLYGALAFGAIAGVVATRAIVMLSQSEPSEVMVEEAA
ncbi:MAG: MFS transporter [Deltaproteobacteria bacterium]